MPERPDFASREPAELARIFTHFGEVECPQLDAQLYRALCAGIRDDPELLALAAHAPPTQPPPNLLFGAVHYLLLDGLSHELRAWYPGLAEGAVRAPESAFPVFRDLCLAHPDAVRELIETRLTQTNVIQRCTALLPAFARIFEEGGGRPLALVEIGCSAGLNLQWSRFRYDYADGAVTWGDPESTVTLPCALRGDRCLPALPQAIPVASRSGVDLRPVDVSDPDAVQWLRALIWPEHVERQQRLTRAVAIARESPPAIRRGDASVELPGLIEAARDDASICVFATHTLYQFPRDALRATLRAMGAASRERPVDFVSMEGTGDRCSELYRTRYRGGERETTLVANCNPHGRWLEWLV